MTEEPQDIVAKADALLANVTPGAWALSMNNGKDYDSLFSDTMPDSDDVESIKRVIEPISEEWGAAWMEFANPADAAFIVAAPALVRDLVAEVKRLRAELEAPVHIIKGISGADFTPEEIERIKAALSGIQDSGRYDAKLMPYHDERDIEADDDGETNDE